MEFGVLGPLRVECDGVAVALPRSRVVRGLLGAFLVAEGRPLPAGRLISMVWADDAEVRNSSAQVGVSRLRGWLAAMGCAGGPSGGGTAVVHDGGGYRLTVERHAVDLGRFRALASAAAEATKPTERFQQLEAALGVRRGPVLADLAGLDPTDPLIHLTEEAVREAALLFAKAAVAVRHPAAAVHALTAIAVLRPLDEPVHAQLIELLADSGRPAEALCHYQRLRSRLADQLGVSPSADIQQAYLDVLDRDRLVSRNAG
jgi:DNA-binding SARP family transcriptional activator